MPPPADPSGQPRGHHLLIGDTPLARRVCAALAETSRPLHLTAPDDDALRTALTTGPAGVAVLVEGDPSALRYALAVRHLAPRVPLTVSVFDRTTSEQLTQLLPQCTVFSPADLLAPTLAGLCAAPGLASLHPTARGPALAGRQRGGTLEFGPWQPGAAYRRTSRLGRIRGQLRPVHRDDALLVGGLAGMLAVLAADTGWLAAGLHQPASTAFLTAARVVAGVGPADVHPQHRLYQTAAALMMLATLALTAVLTAGLVNRLSGPRLTGIVGRRAVPRSGHVLVAGIGHIGLRLCQTLQQAGVPVVGIERDPAAGNLRLAKALGIPVVLAHAQDRRVLGRPGLRRARALAAVGSDELDNIAVAVAAHGVAPGIRVVLRAGEDEAIAETRSLLPLGHTRDVNRSSAAYVVAHLTTGPPRLLVADTDCDWLDLPAHGLLPTPAPTRDDCPHTAARPGGCSALPSTPDG